MGPRARRSVSAPIASLASDMRSRDEVLALIRAHLADELDIDVASIEEETRFKEDLEADSLDLYTLVQELEDTYSVRISDEQAVEIRTVGEAADFVVLHLGDG